MRLLSNERRNVEMIRLHLIIVQTRGQCEKLLKLDLCGT